MVDRNFIALIQRIREKTNGGGVNWEETVNESMFQATLGKFVVRIEEEPDESGANYRFSLVDSVGRVIDTASNMDFRGVSVPENFSPYEVLRTIFESARRRALGAGEAIESILRELDSLVIHSALYGAGDHQIDVTEVLRGMVKGNALEVTSGNQLAGDPLPGTPKVLKIDYSIGGRRLKKEALEGEVFRLP